ncbi:hypothetical protein ACLKMH_22375 [Psychromonas sp. KJ10-10]|uniref:hypothetical protein n=1 Tax=Psychromonas sp. KJ10-10 TaxID=3391823 RepID=UPI0039B3BD10
MNTTKKFLLTATAVAVMSSTSAMAKTVYQDDNMYLNLTGEVAFELIRDVDDGDEMDSKTDNVDLEVKAGYKLENGVEVYGFYAFEFAGWSEEQSSAKDLLKDHWIVTKKGGLEVKFGDFDYSVDEFGINQELDSKTGKDMLNPDDSYTSGSKSVLQVKYKGDGYYVSASFDPKLQDNDTSEETSYDIFAKVDVTDDVTLGAVYSVQEYYDVDIDGISYDSYGVQASYTGVKGLTLGVAYSYGDMNEASGIDLATEIQSN